MREILNRMARTEIFEFIIFTDETIKNEPVEAWPICDCLISFYSYGFPLDKAIAYTKLRSPLVLNDLEMQYDLLDRLVYSIQYSILEITRGCIFYY